jgi:hypothetical protein
MGLNSTEALRLTHKCIPYLRIAGNKIPSNLPLTENDLDIRNVCRLWAGMGYVYDISFLASGDEYHFIVKRIIPPPKNRQSFGDKRKADSYEVEANFYDYVAQDLVEHGLAIPKPYFVEKEANGEITICMSRLDGSGGPSTDEQIQAVLRWMATLHSATWGSKADKLVEKGLQPIGSYWHLDTRPSEYASMSRRGWEGRLKKAARAINERLKRDKMQCCIHGDAKDANMLFYKNEGMEHVAMYDFQYCGKAPPSVDLAYFLCVGVGSTDKEWISYYHSELIMRLPVDGHVPSLEELEDSVALAFCDFQRFMCGWGNWGCDLSGVVRSTLERLDDGKELGSENDYIEAMRREFG